MDNLNDRKPKIILSAWIEDVAGSWRLTSVFLQSGWEALCLV